MPKVKVDGIEVEVPQGATVLQACEAAGDFDAHGIRLGRRDAPTKQKAPEVRGFRENRRSDYSPSLPMASTGQPSRASMHLSIPS